MKRHIVPLAMFLVACSPNGQQGKVGAEGSTLVAAEDSSEVTYETCDDAIADGAAPLNEGDPGYSEKLDRDGDGVACEDFSHDRDFEDVGDTSLCNGDCSGHDAGFDWARDHEITDEADCGGYSQSFIEGCQTYVSTLDDNS